MKYQIPVAVSLAIALIVWAVFILGGILDARFAEVKHSAVQAYKDSHQVYVDHYSHGSVCVRGREYELIELVARVGELMPVDTGFKCASTPDNTH